VKLLFDENLSRQLMHRLANLFPGSEHVAMLGLAHTDDTTIWEFAKANGLVIVTKDSDFHQRNLVFGPPPAVVWLRLGNASTDEIEHALRMHTTSILDLETAQSMGLLIIDGGE
jgi:predicted nuclease of predicted toxin-antitoxin system